MAQLIVRRIEDAVVRKLKLRAARDGVSMEEEHRRILRESLLEKPAKPKMNLIDFLATMPDVPDSVFEIPREMPGPPIDLS
jgi:plasmid stability protein